jgi:glycosyltransferase involved in cell wall biosynthesis
VLSERVIATADAAAENLTMLGIPRKRIDVIINGSEAVREVSESELESARARWGIAANEFTVGICARLEPCKGHETFLRAAKRLTEQYPWRSFRFLVVGDGSRRAELEVMCETLGLESSVTFTGFVKDMALIYRLLRVNVNCSSGTETSCLAISEGMSAGVPAIVSDYGGNRAMIGDGMAGIVYPVGNVDALAEAIGRIASDCVLESKMRRAARDRYERFYTAAAMTESVTRVYEKLLKLGLS